MQKLYERTQDFGLISGGRKIQEQINLLFPSLNKLDAGQGGSSRQGNIDGFDPFDSVCAGLNITDWFDLEVVVITYPEPGALKINL